MKIALGTVQWGLDYGIANTNGIPDDKGLTNILSMALDNKINLLDTAAQYGNAEKRLGQLATAENKIITKIGSFSDSNSLKIQLENSFQNLKRVCIYGCLFHNSNELLENKQYWSELLNYKKTGKIKKIGYSLYHPEVLVALLEEGFLPDIVQIPYSILDRKFEPYFELLKEKGVEIHVRSVFLQGLYFKNPNQLSKKLSILKSVLNEIQNICKKNELNTSQFCLDFIRQNDNIDYAIIGIESETQLKEIIQVNNCELNWDSILKSLNKFVVEKKLLNPSNW